MTLSLKDAVAFCDGESLTLSLLGSASTIRYTGTVERWSLACWLAGARNVYVPNFDALFHIHRHVPPHVIVRVFPSEKMHLSEFRRQVLNEIDLSTCPECLATMSRAVFLKCKHVFHPQCAKEPCPVCMI